MTTPNEAPVSEDHRKVPLIDELRIEASLVPHRRGEPYAIAAAELERLSRELQSAAPVSLASDVSLHCPNCEALAAEVKRQQALLESVARTLENAVQDFDDIRAADAAKGRALARIERKASEVLMHGSELIGRGWLEDIHGIALSAAPAQPTADTPVDAGLVFDAGWIMAANWANRDDLISDMGSPAYIADKTTSIQAIAQPTESAAVQIEGTSAQTHERSFPPAQADPKC